jgi:hypothetical protein
MIRVKINYAQLRQRLSAEAGRQVRYSEAREWLREAGFDVEDDDTLACDDDAPLGKLRGDEILSLERDT